MSLPPGFALDLTDLRVFTPLASSRVAKDGTFTAYEPDGGPALVLLLDDSDRLLLYGIVDADAPAGSNAISARTTAVALIFQATGAFTLPASERARVLDLIDAAPGAEALSRTIADRAAASPTALSDADPEIRSALSAAVAAIVSVPAIGTLRSRVGGPSQVLVEPSEERSGLMASPSPSSDGIVITNHFRRHVQYFVHRTAYQSAGGADVLVEPWAEVRSPARFLTSGDFCYVPAVNGLSGVLGTLVDVIGGQTPYAPVTSAAIELPIEPPDARKVSYRVHVIGASSKSPSIDPYLEGLDASLADDMSSTHTTMVGLEFFQEVALPGLLAIVPSNAVGKWISGTAMAKLTGDLVRVLSDQAPDIVEAMIQGNYRGAFVSFLRALVQSERLRATILERIIAAGMLKGAVQDVAVGFLAHAAAVLQVCDGILSAVDLGMVLDALNTSLPLERFDVTAVPPAIRLQPTPVTVLAGSSVTLTTTGVAGFAGTKTYEYETLGLYGRLEDDRGHSGRSFASSQQSVRYVAKDDAPDGETEEVSVTAYLVPERGDKVRLGTGTALVVVSGRTFDLQPKDRHIAKESSLGLTLRVTPPFSPETVVEYEWSSTTNTGSISDSEGRPGPFTSRSPTAMYHSNRRGGVDTVSVKAMRVVEAQRVTLFAGSTTVVVNSTIAVTKLVVFGPYYWVSGDESIYEAGVAVISVWKGFQTYRRVILHTPGDPVQDGRLEEIGPGRQITRDEISAQYGGHNAWNLAEDELAYPWIGRINGVRSIPPMSEAESRGRFEATFPGSPGSLANDGDVQRATSWSLEVLE